MATQYTGSCLCGGVNYTLAGEFQSFYLCYCHRCQKGTGSAHAANLFAPSAALTWTRGEEDVKTYRHANTLHARSFCRLCGSALPVVAEHIDCVVVPAGSLDSPVPIAPTARIFLGSGAPWATHLTDIPAYQHLPECPS